MELQKKQDFKYATLYDAQQDVYCTNGQCDDLVMGPETAKRFAENDDCAVTICCITYKHEEFIRDALDSFLMQKTNFKYKIFVGEDCGPDSTADIVREYAEKYPDIIVPFLREKNMGAQANLIDLCNHATSPYIAFCEGDDYWVDEYKLQKQYDYMQANPELRVAFTKAEISAPDDWFLRSWFKADKQGRLVFPDCEPTYKPKKKSALYTAWDCVWVFPAHTATVFYRWNYDVEIPDWYFTGIIGDHPIFLMQLGEGKAGMLNDVTAVYRRSDVGVYMSADMDEHFMKTRIDHVRWMSGMLDWYSLNQDYYPGLQIRNRIKREAYNYLRTALRRGDYDSVLMFFNMYPKAAKIALDAFLTFFADGTSFIRTMTWKGYKLLVDHKGYRYGLRGYSMLIGALHALRKLGLRLLKRCRNFLSMIGYWWYSFTPKRKNLWVITSFRGRGYLDNVKYFYEHILETHPEIDLYWLTKDDEIYEKLKSEGKPVCKFGTHKCRKLLSHACIAITDHNIMSDYDKLSGFNNRTKVVQLWHGVGFKAMGDGKVVKLVKEPGVVYSTDILPQPGDSAFKRFWKKLKYFRHAHGRELFEKYFLFVCPGQERVDMIGKVWNIPEESWFMAGHPRNVLLYETYPDAERPMILYAPTFRYVASKENELVENCIDSFEMIQQKMEEINGTFVIRLHPHTWRDYKSKISNRLKNYDRILLDEEKDIYTTLGNYSVVITDYSSISMDFAMLDRPTVFYCPDFDWFSKKQAGFNLDFKNSIPGPMTFTWEETMDKVLEYHADPDKDAGYRREKTKYFFDQSVNGPDNSERIVVELKRRLGID